jgi:hypothetical protein
MHIHGVLLYSPTRAWKSMVAKVTPKVRPTQCCRSETSLPSHSCILVTLEACNDRNLFCMFGVTTSTFGPSLGRQCNRRAVQAAMYLHCITITSLVAHLITTTVACAMRVLQCLGRPWGTNCTYDAKDTVNACRRERASIYARELVGSMHRQHPLLWSLRIGWCRLLELHSCALCHSVHLPICCIR